MHPSRISTTHTVLPKGGGAGWRRSGPDSGLAGQQLDVQHCADPISTTHTVLPKGGGAGSAG